MNHNGISNWVIRRLPRYYRFLGELRAAGITRISSRELAERMGLTASQIRQDLNCFGGFGQQGYGYTVESLYLEIGQILGLEQPKNIILIGAGNIGRAVGAYLVSGNRGFRLVGIFDRKESLIGQMIGNIPIRSSSSLDEFCRENLPKAAILCVPKEEAHDIAEQLVHLNVKCFWNFSHYDLSMEFPEAIVENMHWGDSLMTLSYRIEHEGE